jgi:hypothetical protein
MALKWLTFALRGLNKREFKLILKKADSDSGSLLMYNSVRGLNLSMYFTDMSSLWLKWQWLRYPQWLHYCVLHWLAWHVHFKRLNMKLQCFAEPKTVMFSIVIAHEKKVTWTVVHQSTFLDWTILKFLIIQRRLIWFLRYHHLSRRKFLLNILRLKTLRRNTKFTNNPDAVHLENFKIEVFEWIDLTHF